MCRRYRASTCSVWRAASERTRCARDVWTRWLAWSRQDWVLCSCVLTAALVTTARAVDALTSPRETCRYNHTHTPCILDDSLIYFVYPWIHSKLIWVSCKQHCWQIKFKNLSTQISNFKSGSYNYLLGQNFGSDLWIQKYHSFPLLKFGFRIYCQFINKILPLYTYL